jgi:hypothetical protein
MKESKKIRIIFKSGESLVLEVTDFNVHLLNGNMTGMDWKHSDGAPFRLAFVDIAEVAAVCQIMDGD